MGTANAALLGQKTGTSTRVGLAEYYELSSDDGRPPRGRRVVLLEFWPEGKLQRHAGIGYEIVQSLSMFLFRRWGNSCRISSSCLPAVAGLPSRYRSAEDLTGLRQPQMADQLVDVPIVVSYSSLQQLIAEQIVDIPALGREGRGAWRSSRFTPGQNSASSHVEQTVDIPFARSGGLQGSRPGQGSAASSSHVGAADDARQGVFRTFLQGKKCGVRSELSADFNPSTLSAHQMFGLHLRTPEQLVDVPSASDC